MSTGVSARDYLRNLLAHSPERKLPRKEIMKIMLEAGYAQHAVQWAGTSPPFYIESGPGPGNTSIWGLRK